MRSLLQTLRIREVRNVVAGAAVALCLCIALAAPVPTLAVASSAAGTVLVLGFFER